MMWMHPLSDRILVLTMALLLSLVLGNMRFIRSLLMFDMPAQWFGRYVCAMEQRLNRPQRGEKALKTRGGLLMLLCIAGGGFIGAFMTYLAVHFRAGQALEVLTVTLLVQVHAGYQLSQSIYGSLKKQQIDEARQALSVSGYKDAERLDSHGIARTAIELMAIGMLSYVVTPALAYLIGGLPLAFAVAVVLKMEQSYRITGVEREMFSLRARQMCALIYLIPERMAVFLAVCASIFAPGNKSSAAIKAVVDTSHHAANIAHGLILSAWAGSLRISLAGPYRRRGVFHEQPWIESGSAKIELADLVRAQWLYRVSVGLLCCAVLIANIII